MWEFAVTQIDSNRIVSYRYRCAEVYHVGEESGERTCVWHRIYAWVVAGGFSRASRITPGIYRP